VLAQLSNSAPGPLVALGLEGFNDKDLCQQLADAIQPTKFGRT
jgi:hypothetical protein